jgi:DNA-directed RNA polymerase II subunit RPB1
MQRKLIKSFEDIMIKYDGTVRNAANSIIQFVYGDSGADTITQFEYEIQMLEMNNEQLEKMHKFTDQELKNFGGFSNADNNKLFEDMKKMRNHILKCVRKAKLDYIAKIKAFMIPVNLNRIIDDVKGKKAEKTTLTPKYILEKLEKLLSNDETPLVCMNKREKENKNSFKYRDEQIHKTIFRIALYDGFSPKKILLEYGLDKETFDQTIDNIAKNFERNMVEPGEMVGVIAATATGEPLTQMNLSSFHQAGVSRTNVGNLGVPRMREIFSVSKNPKAPEMKIYLTPDIRNKKEIVHKIKSNLKHTVFNEIRKRITCYYDPNPNFKQGLTLKDNIIPFAFTNKGSTKTSCQTDIGNLPYLIRIEMDREKMAEKEIKLLDVVSQFCNWWEMRFVDTKNIRKEEKRVMNKITQMAVMSNSDNSSEQIIHIRFNARDSDKDKFDLNTVNDFITYSLDKFKLKGVNGITDIQNFPEDKILVFDEETGEIKNEKEFAIYTSGVNLHEIRYMNGIDLNKTIANDIVEMYNTFGIEIVRSLLMSEISNAYSLAGGEVNLQHIEIIVDQMTMTGSINSIDRHGLSKSDADPLSRASFEKPVEQLWTAALFGEVDSMHGVSSRIMVGSVIKGGTGYCDLILNTEMIENAEYEESEYDKKYEEVKVENITTDILKKGEDENVFMPF